MTSDSVEELISAVELAMRWDVSIHTVRHWVRLGKLQPVGIARKLLFRSADCQRFLQTSDRATLVRKRCDGQGKSRHDAL